MSQLKMKTLKLLCLLLFVVSSCSAKVTQNDPIQFESYEIKVDKGFSIKAELGKLEIPENRAVNNNQKITLHFVRLKSLMRNPGPPIIYLSGGPGVSGISMLKTERLIIFQALRAFGDVIILDQRGTGTTEPVLTTGNPLDLPLDKPVDAKESMDVFFTKMRQTVSDLKKNNIDINAYNTKENAEDINDLRKALGADKMILWGYSYGSHLALAVIKQYGQFVEKAILSGVNGLNQRFRMPTDINEVFNEIDKLIGKEPKLRKLIPSFTALVKQELEKLEKQPVAADINVGNKKVPVTIGRADVEIFTSINLATIAFVRELPQLFYNMSQGNYYAAAEYSYKVLKERPQGTPMSFSMHYASGCSLDRMKEIHNKENEGILHNAINYPFITDELRSIWNISDLGEDFRKPFLSPVPVLLISGNLDGRTSITDAKEVRKNFSNSLHIIFNNASHDLLAPQIVSVMETFLKGDLHSDAVLEVSNFDFYSPNSTSLNTTFTTMLIDDGVEKFREYFTKLCAPESDTYISNTQILLTVYQLLKQKKADLAIETLKINQDIFKEENWQLYNALGDCYLEAGNKTEAMKNYKHSVELNPLNIRGFKILNGTF